jgi:catechol 2,3-dioxygenase-like lactoylglutathione lyase family enzyme
LTKTSEQHYRVPTSILETVVYCSDLVAAGEFYEQVVGLQLLSHEPNRHRFYRLDGGMLLIFRAENTERATVRIGQQLIPKHGAHGPGHLAFAIDHDQHDAVRQRLSKCDVPIEAEIDWPNGGRSIYCRDPAGNSVEFATRSLWFPQER